MTKKILVVAGHSRSVFKKRKIGEAICRLKEDKENEMYYLDCHGILDGYCGLNKGKHWGYCEKCYAKCLDLLNDIEFDNDKILKLALEKKPDFPDFKSIQEAIAYNYDGYNIGLGPVSCVMTITRDYAFDIKKWNKNLKKYFYTVYNVIKNIEKYNEIYQFDEIRTFNGRMPFVYGAVSYALKHNLPYYVYTSGANRNKLRTLYKTVPHDFYLCKNEMNSVWEKETDEENKIKLAKKWFQDRRDSKFQVIESFTKNQTKNLLPKGFDFNKENLIFFNSSIDEIYAFESWKHPFANTENEIIEKMLEHYKNDKTKHFYLRVHPNLTKAKKKKTTQIKEINNLKKKYKNLTIIEPNEKIDTYALMEAADKVLTTYSTTGFEATYWGKVSIIAGKAPYEDLDCVYQAHSMEEFIKYIDNKNLKPKPKENTYKYAYYFQVYGEDNRYFKLPDGETGEE